MLSDEQRDLLLSQPERFNYLTLRLPEFCALNPGSIGLEVGHKGRYVSESVLSGKPIIDPYTPLGPLVSLGTISDIENSLEDPEEFSNALLTIFKVINVYATNKVRNDRNTIL
jgi:hypothetical protein